jgi:hypothetical protein
MNRTCPAPRPADRQAGRTGSQNADDPSIASPRPALTGGPFCWAGSREVSFSADIVPFLKNAGVFMDLGTQEIHSSKAP